MGAGRPNVTCMSVDLEAAIRFLEANARLLERRRMQRLLLSGSGAAVRTALLAYANDDGGFGSALEPDVRGPHSEPTAALHALEVFAELDALDDPAVGELAEWVAGVAEPDGGVPFVVPETASHPRGPWMAPVPGGSHLTFAIAGVLYGRRLPWVAEGTAWCWSRLESDEPLDAYSLKFALDFLDAVPAGSEDDERATAAVAHQRPLISADGSVPVSGGTEGERIDLLEVSPRPGSRSRVLFTRDQVEADLDRLERAQQDDGGWQFDWLAWSPGQSAEWRGIVTLRALLALKAHHRL